MSAATTRVCCVSCRQEIAIPKCEGCFQNDRNNQLAANGQEGNRQLNEARANEQQHGLIKQVDDWECNSINIIRQTADEARRLILKHTTERISKVKTKLIQLTAQLGQCIDENNFVSRNVSQWQEELAQLSQQLVAPSNITVREVVAPIVTKIHVDLPALLSIPNIGANAKWIQNGVTVAGGNGQGSELNQLYHPFGIYVDDDETIYVADYSNHRIMEWKKGAISGQVVAGGNGQANQSNQLNSPTTVIVDKETDSLIISDCDNKRVVRWPRRNGTNGEIIISDVTSYGLTMDSYGRLYVCDYIKHEVKRWKIGDRNGTVVAGGNGQGNHLDQLSNPYNVFVDQDHSVYVSDGANHRVIKWVEGAKEGVVVAGGQGAGNSVTQLSNSGGIVVDQLGTIYVADYNNHRVMRWLKGAIQGSVVVGGNGYGAKPNQLNGCQDLSFDRQGNLYICDYDNHRVQKFNMDPSSN